MGKDKPQERVMEIGMAYTSRFYRYRPGDLGDVRALIVVPDSVEHRGAVMVAVEGERWHVSLSGYFGDAAPTDGEGYLAFARSLPTPELYDFLKNAEPLTEPVSARFPANQRRHYERLGRFPAGLLVFGDALCAFNPKYAQGMSVAAMQAMALRDCLKQAKEPLAKRFFAAAAITVEAPWQLVAGGDLKHPKVQGERPGRVKFINWYLGKLHHAAQRDAVVALAFAKVVNLYAPPPSILSPAIALRVLWGNLFRKRAMSEARGSEWLVSAGN
jgi:2-polyprenyl-6-methoxyphenol hydroxylase-like FAD-dependent oxidoreductase